MLALPRPGQQLSYYIDKELNVMRSADLVRSNLKAAVALKLQIGDVELGEYYCYSNSFFISEYHPSACSNQIFHSLNIALANLIYRSFTFVTSLSRLLSYTLNILY